MCEVYIVICHLQQNHCAVSKHWCHTQACAFTAGHFAVSDMRCMCASACRHVIRRGARHTSCGRTACAKACNESTHSSTPGNGQTSADNLLVVGVICLTSKSYFSAQ